MSNELIAAIGAIGAPQAPSLLPDAGVAAPGFADWFSQQVGQVGASVAVADNDVRRMAAGDVTSLHEVMIHMEEAKLSFQLLAQVRNRLLDAYQEVMRMQV